MIFLIIQLMIQCYAALLLTIGVGALSFFLVGMYFIFRKPPINELSAIAGENLMATQLDLARAYIESGKQEIAKKMLKTILLQGNFAEQQEAKRLLGLI